MPPSSESLTLVIGDDYLGDSKRIQGRDKWRVPFHLNQRGDQVIIPDDASDYE